MNKSINILKNTVFKAYIDHSGYKLIWLKSNPILSDLDVERLLPKVDENNFGPALAYNSTRLSLYNFFLTTTSRWSIKNVSERQIFSFSEGNLITIGSDVQKSIIGICKYFVGMLRRYKLGHKRLGKILSNIAKKGDEEDIIKFAAHFVESPDLSLDELTVEQILYISNYLKQQIENTKNKLRVYADFPHHENFSFCCLLGLQVLLPNVTSIGGGYLKYPQNYDLISNLQKEEGFEYLDLGSISYIYEQILKKSNMMVGNDTDKASKDFETIRDGKDSNLVKLTNVSEKKIGMPEGKKINNRKPLAVFSIPALGTFGKGNLFIKFLIIIIFLFFVSIIKIFSSYNRLFKENEQKSVVIKNLKNENENLTTAIALLKQREKIYKNQTDFLSQKEYQVDLNSQKSTIIEYYIKGNENDEIILGLKKLGYDLKTKTSQEYTIPTNYILYGSKVDIDDIKKIACFLIDNNVSIKNISPFYKLSDAKALVVQVGASESYLTRKNLTYEEVQNLEKIFPEH